MPGSGYRTLGVVLEQIFHTLVSIFIGFIVKESSSSPGDVLTTVKVSTLNRGRSGRSFPKCAPEPNLKTSVCVCTKDSLASSFSQGVPSCLQVKKAKPSFSGSLRLEKNKHFYVCRHF